MTKALKAGSTHNAVRRAFRILGEDGIQSAIKDQLGLERSASLIRKCADPDDDRHHLQLRYATAIDAACLKNRRVAPILDAYSRCLDIAARQTLGDPGATKADIFEAVVSLQVSLGELAQLVERAYACEDEGPPGLSLAEENQISDAIDLLEEHAEMFRALVTSDHGINGD